jgi:acetate kinase
MKTLEDSNDPKAAEALSYYVCRVQREIGGMAAVLGGIDALVFCGGVGENSAEMREKIAAKLGFLGIDLDATANHGRQTEINSGTLPVLVIATDEEQVIARAVAKNLQ